MQADSFDVGSSGGTAESHATRDTSRMDPAVKAQWVAALRSGEYQQGKAVLRSRNGGFCCLGVLSDLAIKAGVGGWSDWDDTCYAYRHDGADGPDTGLLPLPVSAWAGFGYPARMGGEVSIDGTFDMLVGHNDAGRTFAEIADAIESQL